MMWSNNNIARISKNDIADASIANNLYATIDVKWNTPLIKTLERNYAKIQVYDLKGFSEDDFKITTEFDNKTEKLFLRIQGEVKDEFIDYENTVDLKEKIDTTIYECLTWEFKNGLLIVIFHEIVKEQPDFKISEAKKI